LSFYELGDAHALDDIGKEVIGKRARQLAKGADALVESSNDKPTVLALREIAGRKVNQELIAEIDKQEREKAEREALEWAAAEVDEDLSKGGDDL